MGQDGSPGGLDPSGWTPRYSPLGGAGAPKEDPYGAYGAPTSVTPQTQPTYPAVPQQWGPPSGGFPGPGGPPGFPPGPGAPPPTGGGKARRSRARIWIAVGVVALLVIGGAAWFAFAGTSSAEAAQVQLEATSTSGPSPFTAPVGQDTTGVVAPANAQGSQPGNTGGLYAQDPAKASCDTASLVSQLGSDPAKSAAWAKSLGIEANQISGFADTLSPVTLRADTDVTAYGYGDGQFQPYPATLQAGTAVLVNSYGEPTVKCYNGDPLGPPTQSNTSGTYVGAPWNGWAAERTIVVTPAPAPITQIVVVNPGTNTPGSKPMPPNPDPKKNPGAPTDPSGKLLLTGTHNYDGTVTLSDGRILDANGKVLPPKVAVTHPAGSKTFPDGSVQEPNGIVFNRDGTERRPVPFLINNGQVAFKINPDGTTTPPVAGLTVSWNYDGTVTIYRTGSAVGAVTTLNPDGTFKSNTPVPPGGVVQPDGSIKNPDGTITNPGGTPRTSSTLPDGTVLDPQGGNTPPPDAKVDKTMQGTDGTLGTENQQAKQGQQGQAGTPGQPGAGQAAPGGPAQPGQPGQPNCTIPAGAVADNACKPSPNVQVCKPDPATGICPVTPDKAKTGTSTDGSSTSGTGADSGTGTSGGSGSSGSSGGSGSSGSSGSGSSGSGSSGGSGSSTSG